MISIFTNTSAMKSANALSRANQVLQSAMERLGTGKRINSAADDAAGLQIATRLQSQSSGMAVAQQNIGKASSMLQTAEGAFNEITNILYRMKDLATQGADDTNSSDDRKSLQSEFNALNKELANIFSNTSYGEEKLFGATFNAAVNKPDSAVINKSAAAEINLRPAAAPKVNPAAAHTGSFTPEYMSYSAYGGGPVTMTGHAADGSPVRKIFYMDDPDFTRAFTYFADNNMALLNGDRIPPFILEDVTEKPAVTEPVATPEVESEPEVEPAAAPASVIKSAVDGKLASVLHFQIGAGKDEVMELDLSGQLRNVSGALGDL
ncbi:hypothetical protein [Izhakiella australiensis]|uniref:flagellin N-terminal helical domain-containing protein n=1 Tax=Izhakiella australiensis TaxID=1926881 RepID=UPI00098F4802|nr:hypothetical protein [Izhakiella australiensis]